MTNLGTQPTEAKTKDLSGVFAPDRAAGLRNLLPKPHAPKSTEAPSPPAPNGEPVPPAEKAVAEMGSEVPAPRLGPPVERRAPSKKRQPAQPDPTAVEPQRAIDGTYSARIPLRLLEKVKAQAKQKRVTLTEVVFDAIEAEYERLEELFTPANTGARVGGLFKGKVRSRRPQIEPMDQITLRLMPDDAATLNSLVFQHRAGSRSHFVAQVLERYFA